jgi:hypothetical protein
MFCMSCVTCGMESVLFVDAGSWGSVLWYSDGVLILIVNEWIISRR